MNLLFRWTSEFDDYFDLYDLDGNLDSPFHDGNFHRVLSVLELLIKFEDSISNRFRLMELYLIELNLYSFLQDFELPLEGFPSKT